MKSVSFSFLCSKKLTSSTSKWKLQGVRSYPRWNGPLTGIFRSDTWVVWKHPVSRQKSRSFSCQCIFLGPRIHPPSDWKLAKGVEIFRPQADTSPCKPTWDVRSLGLGHWTALFQKSWGCCVPRKKTWQAGLQTRLFVAWKLFFVSSMALNYHETLIGPSPQVCGWSENEPKPYCF